ncbi:MAG TPA: hypothetical protein PKN64_03455, partial [Casimicrobium sp.]|nr:hypothetical protein [Casimicrobium sp.]
AYSALDDSGAGLLPQPSAGGRKKSNEHNDTHRKVKHVHDDLVEQEIELGNDRPATRPDVLESSHEFDVDQTPQTTYP